MFKRALGWLVVAACVDPRTSSVEQPIIGGTTAQPSDFPTVIELEGHPGDFECTGTLIDPSWVMVAAHCMEQLTATTGHIRFDGNNVVDHPTGTVVGLRSVHVDPMWTGATSWVWTHDLALLELAAPKTDRTPTPLYIAAVAPGTTVLTVGYGNDNNTNGGAGILRQLSTPTMDCAGTSDPNMQNANVLCFDGRDNTSSCYGDSGGPAFLDVDGVRTVAGATSGGTLDTEACTGPDAFYAYTAVIAELAFIQQYVPAAVTGGVGSGSAMGSGSDMGSGSGDPIDPGNPGSGSTTPDGGDKGGGGCAATGSGSLAMAVVVLALARRRRG